MTDQNRMIAYLQEIEDLDLSASTRATVSMLGVTLAFLEDKMEEGLTAEEAIEALRETRQESIQAGVEAERERKKLFSW